MKMTLSVRKPLYTVRRETQNKIHVLQSTISSLEEKLLQKKALQNKNQQAFQEFSKIKAEYTEVQEVINRLQTEYESATRTLRNSRSVRAVNVLAGEVSRLSSNQKMGVLGFLRNVAKVKEQKYCLAINSILRSSLAKVVIVSSRKIALNVLDYFNTNKIG